MRYIYTLLCFAIILLWSSCRNDFETTSSTGDLRFSKDTVYLDTVFTNIGSSTFNLKVYNRSDDAITIPTVQLGQGENSNYRLNVDGVPGRIFEDVEILAKDSIFIFIETTIDIAEYTSDEGEFIYTDAIQFDSGANAQKVELVTLVRDAVFLFPDRDGATGVAESLILYNSETQMPEQTQLTGRYLMDDELNFTADKPYVIYGYMAVGDPVSQNPKTLNIAPGARIHVHADSGIIVDKNATLKINGELSLDPELLENEVIFESDRLEPGFADVPGQWGTILLTTGSVDNEINYATIRNATVGILNESRTNTGNPNLRLSNTQIYNSSAVGLLNRFSTVVASNTVINNAGQFSLLIQLGGSYDFTHCTFANYWRGTRTTPAVFIDNTLLNGTVLEIGALTQANFTNSIIYGLQREELLFNRDDAVEFNYNFKNTLIRFDNDFGDFDTSPFHDFTDTSTYQNVIISEEPSFLDPRNSKLQIDEASSANNLGDTNAALIYPFDIIGTNRTASPDLGAYQSITFPDMD